MAIEKITFKPQGTKVMLEQVQREQAVKIHLPGNASAPQSEVDTIVRAVGPEVKNFEVGDVVVCSVKDLQRCGKFDAGAGVKVYGFINEEDIFGKF